MTPTAGSEQDELISCLERMQDSFERRALSSMAQPLISTPLTMQQLKVLTMIAIDPDRATGHELAAQLKVSVATMSGPRRSTRGTRDGKSRRGCQRPASSPAQRNSRRGVRQSGVLLSSAGTMPTPVLRRLAIEDLRALVQGILAFDRAVRELAEGAIER